MFKVGDHVEVVTPRVMHLADVEVGDTGVIDTIYYNDFIEHYYAVKMDSNGDTWAFCDEDLEKA